MMLSSYPLWWLALPALLLPVWWHRQKRQRLKAEMLATARFLPSAPPEQLRVWQWRDKLLLLVRCLMLAALIAWLAATIFPWRGDTVLVDAGVDKAWAEKEIAAAGFSAAARAELPPNALQWLRANERDWRADAKLLIVARASQIAMPARLPQYNHQLTLRTHHAIASSPTASAAAPAERQVVLAAPDARSAAWRALFAAFSSAGEGVARYATAVEPDAKTALIVWDTPDTAPPANWRAPHWWITTPAAFPELANATPLTINGITLKYAHSPRGRLWTSDAFPPRDASTARSLYEAWQLLDAAPAPAYPAPSQTFTAARSALPAIVKAQPASWLALALLTLFMIERILAHARRN
ncbi:BatA domain-containing protein [Duganella sp.]|uniref:BatA domain-containing protein n=1 Tax=Duganella sp. TaxID=1904440 RepID=UPI0031DEF89E